MNDKNNSVSISSSVRTMSVRPSFYEVMEDVMRWSEYELLENRYKQFAYDICKIITEVMLLNPDREMQIGNDMVSIGTVQEIYKSLGKENIELVIDNFEEQTQLIKNKKAYIRAALYNSFFEIDAHYTNLVRHDFS